MHKEIGYMFARICLPYMNSLVTRWVGLLLIGSCLVFPFATMAQSPVGRWTTIDDKTGEKRVDVEISLEKDELVGTIVHRYVKDKGKGICSSCPGQFKNQPIQGLRFIWGLKKEGPNVWGGGQLLDPTSGKIYHLKLSVQDNQLHVRGYIGVPLLGRTQIWPHARA